MISFLESAHKNYIDKSEILRGMQLFIATYNPCLLGVLVRKNMIFVFLLTKTKFPSRRTSACNLPSGETRCWPGYKVDPAESTKKVPERTSFFRLCGILIFFQSHFILKKNLFKFFVYSKI